MSRRRTGTRVVFLHIGRTGGTTLTRVLRREYPGDAVHEVDSSRSDPTLAGLVQLPDDRERVELLSGHVWFGAHELLPPPVTYVTLLREPVDRLLSHYHYVCQRPDHFLHALVARQRPSFTDYVTGGVSLELDNWQTRVLAGDVSTPFGQCGPELLAQAKRNVERWFAVVGLLERFDETLLLCRRRLGLGLPFYVRRNALAERRARAELSGKELEAAVTTNRLDVELYEWAQQRFDAAVAGEPAFDRALRAFRLANLAYAPWGALRRRAGEIRHERQARRTPRAPELGA
jgi:hypothetical protein